MNVLPPPATSSSESPSKESFVPAASHLLQWERDLFGNNRDLVRRHSLSLAAEILSISGSRRK